MIKEVKQAQVEHQLIVFLIHDVEIYCLDERYVSVLDLITKKMAADLIFFYMVIN